jgi:hypothetical protein
MGNFVSRLDLSTGKFAEIPFPTPQAPPRFLGIDQKGGRVWFTESLLVPFLYGSDHLGERSLSSTLRTARSVVWQFSAN